MQVKKPKNNSQKPDGGGRRVVTIAVVVGCELLFCPHVERDAEALPLGPGDG